MSTHGNPDTDPISAKLLFGNPSTACSGMGVCHLSPAPAGIQGSNDNSGISVMVSTGDPSGLNSNLIIGISASSMEAQAALDYGIYTALINGAAGGSGFNTDITALPFVIDPGLVQSLWPAMANSATPIAYIPQTAINWASAGDANDGITLTVPRITFSATSPLGTPPPVKVNQQSINIGNWTIAPDAYGNLCFSSMVQGVAKNQIIMGVNGNLSINNMNVITDNSPIYISNNGQNGAVLDATEMGMLSDTEFTKVYQPGDWVASTYWGQPSGTDQDSNLVIHLGNPFPVV